MRLRFKKWAEPYIDAHLDLVFKDLKDDDEQFQLLLNRELVYLEIGGGRGDFVVQMANKYPESTFIMVEKNVNAAAVALRKIVSDEIKNAFIIVEDIHKVFPVIGDEKVDGIFLNFSDPWPKAKHEKRRLTYDSALEEYRRILKDGASVAFKTDNPDFYTYSLAKFREFNWTIDYNSYNYSGALEFDAESEYETNFRQQMQPICRLVATKGKNTYAINE